MFFLDNLTGYLCVRNRKVHLAVQLQEHRTMTQSYEIFKSRLKIYAWTYVKGNSEKQFPPLQRINHKKQLITSYHHSVQAYNYRGSSRASSSRSTDAEKITSSTALMMSVALVVVVFGKGTTFQCTTAPDPRSF